ncbi:hypothetical protein FFONT_1240 [Fervidicoccus fontis Kam940]|uniref:Uncharacterized protein n=3 Tax=Fervidicoccus fontis TaxID=683846 RepID=I0A2M1_FERFK|nr:hypothetical protein FFONT_1240 [Fervidicoccus fontis Kam940]PMB75900.1 MAG: hypothetical protein C0188_01020 [Fervidicoccus fontis]PMB77389.1 MAG: hypothetical protein C0177_03145 [Fervidicoccus fontis]
MEYIHDPEIRKVMNEIIASYKELAPVFKAVPPYDYPYAILLSGLIKALKRIDEIEQMVEHKS